MEKMIEMDYRILKMSLPTPFPVGNVNVYFIDGPAPTLVDAGVFSSKSLNALSEQLRAHGRRQEDIRRILITHDHYDHSGAAPHLSQQYGADLYLHEKSKLNMEETSEANTKLFEFILRCGAPRDMLERAFQMFSAGFQFADHASKPHAVRRLRGGEMISCEGMTLLVAATPGHSPDSLCYYDESRKCLFCGDLLLPHITPNPLLHLDPLADYQRTHSLLNYIDSLDKLEGMEIQIAYPGHGPVIEDVPGSIAKNKRFIAQRRQSVLEKISAGSANPFHLARALFGELSLTNQYLAISETVAYLDLLERDEKISVDWEGELISIRLL
jgi:glyoxylase-like metal-dependent hydrolase (beta-lactamase superfamily II)